MKKLLIVLLAFGLQASAQDMALYKRVVKELSSKKYQGRGYAKDGANKAGNFLLKEYKKAGVDEVTTQTFKLDVQTFAGEMEMMTLSNSPLKGEDDKVSPLRGDLEGSWNHLQPGVDFSMREYSPGVKG